MGAFPPVKGATALEMRALALNAREERTLRDRKKLNELETVNTFKQLEVDERKMKQRSQRLHKKIIRVQSFMPKEMLAPPSHSEESTPFRSLQVSRIRGDMRQSDLEIDKMGDEPQANRLQRQVALKTQRGVYRALLAQEKAKAASVPLLVPNKGFVEFASSVRQIGAGHDEGKPLETSLDEGSPARRRTGSFAARSPQGKRRINYLQDKFSTALRGSWESVTSRYSSRPLLASRNDDEELPSVSQMSDRQLFERKRLDLLKEEARKQREILREQEAVIFDLLQVVESEEEDIDDDESEGDLEPEQQDPESVDHALYKLRHCRYLRTKHVLTPDAELVATMFEQQMYLSKVQLWKIMSGNRRH